MLSIDWFGSAPVCRTPGGEEVGVTQKKFIQAGWGGGGGGGGGGGVVLGVNKKRFLPEGAPPPPPEV